jgi:hypothetical protein
MTYLMSMGIMFLVLGLSALAIGSFFFIPNLVSQYVFEKYYKLNLDYNLALEKANKAYDYTSAIYSIAFILIVPLLLIPIIF